MNTNKPGQSLNQHHFLSAGALAIAAALLLPGILHAQTPTPAWVNRYHGPGRGVDKGKVIAADGAGRVFVSGNSSYAPETIGYASSGTPIWTNRFSDPGDGSTINAMAVGNGKVCVTGFHSDTPGSPYSAFQTIAYSDAGMPLWTNRFDGGAKSHDEATVIVVAPNGVFTFQVFRSTANIRVMSRSLIRIWESRFGQTDMNKRESISPSACCGWKCNGDRHGDDCGWELCLSCNPRRWSQACSQTSQTPQVSTPTSLPSHSNFSG